MQDDFSFSPKLNNMDERFETLGIRSNPSTSKSFENQNKFIISGSEYSTGTTSWIKYSVSPNINGKNFNRAKRKWSGIDGPERTNDASLALALGCPVSSSDNSCWRSSATLCTIFSAKETDEESSMDVPFNFRLHLGNESTPALKTPGVTNPKVVNEEWPTIDLQLNLCLGPSESVITSTTPAHDGSTSSRLKNGSVVFPYLYASEGTTGYIPIPHCDLSSIILPERQSPVASTSGFSQLQQRNSNTKKCHFQGCGKGARGATGLCIAHGGGRRCQKAGCKKGAEGRTIFCKAHGGGRRCEHLGCTKSAEGRSDHCIAHGGGRRCVSKDCTRAARGKSGLCIRHGGGKRCKMEACTKSAEGYSGLCISHGGGRRCQYPECTKGAQGSTMHCKAHGGGKRCTFTGCGKGAEGSTPFCKGHGGGKRCSFAGGCSKSVHGGTSFCVAHGGGKRCSVPDCTKSARGRTDCCVRHGGGKRCKFEGCTKSAQGSTDLCKAHGGGKRCSWGLAGSDLGYGGPTCDRFARGKTGLCAAHSALVEDQPIHGGEIMMKGVSVRGKNVISDIRENFTLCPSNLPVSSLPEGRVHGGNLMLLLASGANHVEGSEQGTSYSLAHRWV